MLPNGILDACLVQHGHSLHMEAIDSELMRGASSPWKHVLLAASDQMLDGNATDHHDM